MATGYDKGMNGHRRALADSIDVEIAKPVIVVPVEPEPVRPCGERLGHGSWCFRPDAHAGEHEGAPPTYGPIEERPRMWRVSGPPLLSDVLKQLARKDDR